MSLEAILLQEFLDPLFGAELPAAGYYRNDWNDFVAVKAARELLWGVQYPSDDVRTSLYSQWLQLFASNQWHESFEGLMLDCVVATPSPTAPETPLFADIFEAQGPTDVAPHWAPALDPQYTPRLFMRTSKDIEPLPSSDGFVDFMSDLLRKSRASRAALDEAGLLIGFLSMALAVVAAKPCNEVQDFFSTRMRTALAAASVPLSFDGEIPCPSPVFLTELSRKVQDRRVVKPYMVLLVLGQYAYHMNGPRVRDTRDVNTDARFLEAAFLTATKYSGLEVVELLYNVQDKLGVSAEQLNGIMIGDKANAKASQSGKRVETFLDARGDQRTKPWCRVTHPGFFSDLELEENLDYALRMTALLAPLMADARWQRAEFAAVSGLRRKAAQNWAKDLKRALAKGKHRAAPAKP